MKKKTAPQPKNRNLPASREPYEAPAIIYEGLITTSSKGTQSDGRSGPNLDPADVFQGNAG